MLSSLRYLVMLLTMLHALFAIVCISSAIDCYLPCSVKPIILVDT